jgi:alkylation response protein AidB-like acyl-CoA dehydrogenase
LVELERLGALVARLAEADGPAEEAGVWPEGLWSLLRAAGAPKWSLPARLGGEECDRVELVERYARVAAGSLTAAFVLSQHDAAVRRLVAVAEERPEAARWLAEIAQGRAFTTVGISQLTTSRRHGASALTARSLPQGGYQLDGVMPWVTAAVRADVIVTGAILDDGRQLLLAVPTRREGLSVRPPFALAALQASCTSEVACEGVVVTDDEVLAGPLTDVMATPSAAGTGGLETSALALGQARAALDALIAAAPQRNELAEPVGALAEAWDQAWAALMAAARAEPNALPSAQVRSQANALVLRITQAYLTARKGTGFLRSEPAQRWARQALFFLVWSCPAPVAQAALRDLAGLCPA